MPRKNANKTVRQVSAFPVPQPDLVQAIGDESFPVMDGGTAGLPDGAGQTAGSIEFRLGAELGAEAVGQAVQQPGGEFVTRAEFDALAARCAALEKQEPTKTETEVK